MTISIFGKQFDEEFIAPIQALVTSLERNNIGILVFAPFQEFLKNKIIFASQNRTFSNCDELGGTDFMISIGGDGTMLETATMIRDRGIPVLGINTGRLGFLSNVSVDDCAISIERLLNQQFSIDSRSLIHVVSDSVDFGDFPFALNEITLLNKERHSMITVHVYVNDLPMNTYWADGLIIATPTGSTAYSLSCGGPIVTPDSNNLILTPIAPHNLNVRPFVISNENRISVRAEGRDPFFLITLDSRSFTINSSNLVELRKAPFSFKLVNLEGQDFFQTIRSKLGWGLDKRN